MPVEIVRIFGIPEADRDGDGYNTEIGIDADGETWQRGPHKMWTYEPRRARLALRLLLSEVTRLTAAVAAVSGVVALAEEE